MIKNKVVSIEYFGIGFSDQTEIPRTNENYVEEIRMALEKSGFTPPYILMPHSYSGIVSEYYANKYPDEIKGIIMLDTTSTMADTSNGPPNFIFQIAKFQNAIGMTRLLMQFIPETKLEENGYTAKEISDYKIFSYHALNNTVINQMSNMPNALNETKVLEFPKSIPVLKLISSDSIKAMSKKNKDAGMNYQNTHLKKFGDQGTYKILDASHFMYQSKVSEIILYTEEFLAKINNEIAQ